uniref:Regulator of hemoglobinization and erythroid cell expansion n=1 Tax=Sciurus vulgaris TaxID=55149 RepID=A0A8D2DY49_SCIVU
MLTEEMKLWHGLVIAVLSLLLQICLLIALNYLLSRNIAHQSERILKEARLQAPEPNPARHQVPLNKETWTESALHYRRDSNTSSDSSVSSAILPSTFQAIKDVSYTPVVFSAPESVLDYENIKEATDYVNVTPENHKPNFWTPVNAAFSEPVEYTQVAV